MALIKSGDHVEYTCKQFLENGTIIDGNEGTEPQFLKAGITFENAPIRQLVSQALVTMKKDETKTVTIPAENAYGAYNESLVFQFPIKDSPENLISGETLTVHLQEGGEIEGVVTDIGQENVTIDANHPYAGQKMFLEISVIDVC